MLDGPARMACGEGRGGFPSRSRDDKGKALPKSLAVSGTLKLGAKATYADGHVGDLLTTKGVTFTSRDTSTGTVSGNTLTWRHGGTILVTATIDGFTSAAASIASAYAPESITVTDGSGATVTALSLRAGESLKLQVRVLPASADQTFTAITGARDGGRGGRRETDRPYRVTGVGDPERGRDSDPRRERAASLRAVGIHRCHPRQDHRNHRPIATHHGQAEKRRPIWAPYQSQASNQVPRV